jgi:DNA-binding MarR family transcriptional regulator
MPGFNADFWEISAGSEFIENAAAESALWFETQQDQERRHALGDFFQEVLPVVDEMIDSHLTGRQREVLRLYYFHGKTQMDIAEILQLSQSTVSRHLFGTVRNGRKVGGAITKLRKVVERTNPTSVCEALGVLETRLGRTA